MRTRSLLTLLAACLAAVPCALAQDPSGAAQLIQTGRDQMKAGSYNDAMISFQAAVDRDASNRFALKGLAAAAFLATSQGADQILKTSLYDQAARTEQRLIELDPNDPDPYYSLGVIDWARSSGDIQKERRALTMAAGAPGPIPDADARRDLLVRFESYIEDGIASLHKALDFNANDSDAMAYLNLLLRERANLRDNGELASADVREADNWVQKALNARRLSPTAAMTATADSPNFRLAPPPPPPPPAPTAMPLAAPPGAVRIGGAVAENNLIRKIEPVYPPLARQARIQGTVRFTITIAKDGTIAHIQLISGHPLLVAAAQQALQQWLYRPTLLNGQPVEVITTADVLFVLV